MAWLAAKALSKLGKAAWPELLRALISKGASSVPLRRGAHHALRSQKEAGFDDLLATLRKSLESGAVPESAPLAAYELLKRMDGSAES